MTTEEKLKIAIEALEKIMSLPRNCGPLDFKFMASDTLSKISEEEKSCVCEEPWIKGVIHNTGSPCYWPEGKPSQKQEECKHTLDTVCKDCGFTAEFTKQEAWGINNEILEAAIYRKGVDILTPAEILRTIQSSLVPLEKEDV
jgi:hypothetical protein